MSYDTGAGVEKNASEAHLWFRRAANQGDASAQVNLGVMYAEGQGATRDPVMAYFWFTLVADHENDAIRNTARSGRNLVV